MSALAAAQPAQDDVPVVSANARPAAEKLSPALRAVNRSAPISFMVDLREQLDFARVARRLEGLSRRDRQLWVARALNTVAQRSQRRLHPLLGRLRREGAIRSWTSVSIVNRLLIDGTGAAVAALSKSRDVATLVEEAEAQGALVHALDERHAPSAWPLDAMAVAEAWRSGVDGAGVVVALIDSGASANHEQLRGNFRGGERSWFDPLHHTRTPSDVQLGHGTAVLSCAVGGAGRGVAPGAQWAAAVGLDEGRYNNVLLTRAADWILSTAHPDVLIAPWRVAGERCDQSLRPILNAWLAAGIVVVFAAGNDGPASGTDVSPANAGGLYPGSASALSVGSVDAALHIDAASSRGPNGCGPALFPQLVAPGAGVTVAFPASPSLYRDASGTSFAAGYVAGVAALLLQRCPRADVTLIENALRQGALDLGAPGPDTTYGYGLVNAARALDVLAKHPSCR
jgi:subtilisin family serine protease